MLYCCQDDNRSKTTKKKEMMARLTENKNKQSLLTMTVGCFFFKDLKKQNF